jgi:hypothetical protein
MYYTSTPHTIEIRSPRGTIVRTLPNTPSARLEAVQTCNAWNARNAGRERSR